MKRAISLILTLALLLALSIPAAAANDTSGTTLRREDTTGTVTVKTSGGQTKSVVKGMRLYNGYTVETGKSSSAAVSLDDAKAVKLGANGKIEIKKTGGKLEVALMSGELLFNVTQPLKSDESLNIRTATMITGIRGTVGWSSPESVALLEGHADAVPADGTGAAKAVGAGEQLQSSGEAAAFTPDDVPALVVAELASDPALRARVASALPGLDMDALVESLPEKQAQEAAAEAAAEKAAETALAAQDKALAALDAADGKTQAPAPAANTDNSSDSDRDSGSHSGGNSGARQPQQPVRFTVTLNANGGKFADGRSVHTLTAERGTKLQDLLRGQETPTKDRVRMTLWFYEASRQTQPGANDAVTHDLTLYAGHKNAPAQAAAPNDADALAELLRENDVVTVPGGGTYSNMNVPSGKKLIFAAVTVGASGTAITGLTNSGTIEVEYGTSLTIQNGTTVNSGTIRNSGELYNNAASITGGGTIVNRRGSTYTPGQNVNNDSVKFVVTFDAGDGAFPDGERTKTTTVGYNDPLPTACTVWSIGLNPQEIKPTRDGYDFTGWKDEAGAPALSTTQVTAATVLTAGWSLTSCALTITPPAAGAFHQSLTVTQNGTALTAGNNGVYDVTPNGGGVTVTLTLKDNTYLGDDSAVKGTVNGSDTAFTASGATLTATFQITQATEIVLSGVNLYSVTGVALAADGKITINGSSSYAWLTKITFAITASDSENGTFSTVYSCASPKALQYETGGCSIESLARLSDQNPLGAGSSVDRNKYYKITINGVESAATRLLAN